MKLLDSLVPLAGVLTGATVCVFGLAYHAPVCWIAAMVLVYVSLKWWREAYAQHRN